jgi:hypothetical protein
VRFRRCALCWTFERQLSVDNASWPSARLDLEQYEHCSRNVRGPGVSKFDPRGMRYTELIRGVSLWPGAIPSACHNPFTAGQWALPHANDVAVHNPSCNYVHSSFANGSLPSSNETVSPPSGVKLHSVVSNCERFRQQISHKSLRLSNPVCSVTRPSKETNSPAKENSQTPSSSSSHYKTSSSPSPSSPSP